MLTLLFKDSRYLQFVYVVVLWGLVVGAWMTTIILFTASLGAAEDLRDVHVIRVYDGDTITVNLDDDYPDVFSKKLGVRIRGIDTPEIRGKCPAEKALAKEARDLVKMMVTQAHQIDLRDIGRGKYFRIVANVVIDGRSVADLLLQKGLAVPYDGGTKTKDWCAP